MKTTVLMILDGYGLSDTVEGNAIAQANTPVMDQLKRENPFVKGYASGLAVGLPDGQMGNSEVGHLNIGAGRVVYQELTRITKSIAERDFFQNPALLAAIRRVKEENSALHLMGLLSDGGVHSHIDHLKALLRLAKEQGLHRVYVHCFFDGRDCPPASGKGYLEEIEATIKQLGVGAVASLSGRYYAMDRDNRWDRVQKAYDCLTLGRGNQTSDPKAYLAQSYQQGVTDEFLVPAVVVDDNGLPVGMIEPEDAVIFYNFRPDRARQLTRAICDPDFTGFTREKRVTAATMVTFTEYDKTIPNHLVAFEAEKLKNTLGEYLSSLGKTQLRLAETEKYAHVTFFFNGGVETPYPGEDRILVPSPKVATYDLQPEMSAYEVTDHLVDAIESGKYDFIVVNYANSDMVGHTGVMKAAIQAVEAVDQCVGRVVDALVKADGQMFLCADHGNSEKMIDETTGEPFTAHTTNPVPFLLVHGPKGVGLRETGRLDDIAPTLLELMGLDVPKEMTGKSLLIQQN